MPEARPQTCSYIGFVKTLPGIARDKAIELLGTEPDQKEFEKFARSWTAKCIPPLHHKLAKDLTMAPEADPADLMEGIAQYMSASDIPIQGLVIPSGKFNGIGVMETFALLAIEFFCGYYGKIADDLAEIAKFKATLERVEHGDGSRFRVPPEKRAELKEKLGATLIDVDAYLKNIEDSTATGQAL